MFFHKNSSLFQKEYIKVSLDLPRKLPLKNIIVISLESLEDSFANDGLVKPRNLIPRLTSLKRDGVNFDGYVDMISMRPTIPSFFAKNCGIPGRPDIFLAYKNYTQFSNARCVFDVLKNNGYHTFFLTGGNLTDEGAASFFKTHPADFALGRKELLKMGVSQQDSTYFIPDSQVYKFAKRLLSEPQNNPFGLYIVTTDTHDSKNGNYYVEKGCKKQFNDFRDAIRCLDKVTYAFIKWCQSQPWYKNTVIYLIGDHLMRNSNLSSFPNKIAKYPNRQVYALMLDGSSNARKINRKFTQVDFAPTFLESVGFTCPALGLGHSLFREKPTLIERLGKKEMENGIQNGQNDFQDIVLGKTFSIEEKK